MAEKNENWEEERLHFWDVKDTLSAGDTSIDLNNRVADLKVSRATYDYYGIRGAIPFQPNRTTFIEVTIEFSDGNSMMIGVATEKASVSPLNTIVNRWESCLLGSTGFVQDESGSCWNFIPSFSDKTRYTIGVLYNDFNKTLGFSLDNEYLGSKSLKINGPCYLVVYCGANTRFTAKIGRCITTSDPNMYSPISSWPVDAGKPLTKREIEDRILAFFEPL